MNYFILSFLFFLTINIAQAQIIQAQLLTRTALDEEGFHITSFNDKPIEELKLPEINLSNAVYFNIYYSRDINDDENISVMVIKNEEVDLLYIDTNNDEDLTNDNSPYIFPLSKNNFTFDIIAPNDSKQIVKIRLRRKQIIPDFSKQRKIDSLLYDSNGNLKRIIAMSFARNSPNFTGEKGTYYFDDRITLSRGETVLSGESYKIGLFDYTNNGLFNDSHNENGDVIIIDLDNDGKLSYSNSAEVFHLNDVFEINNECYQILAIDPYGRFVDLKKTDSLPTFRFLKQISNLSSNSKLSTEFELDSTFWNLEFADLEGQKVKLSSLINQYILLNFWGEWCKPCLMEIPELVAINNFHNNDIKIISFLKTANLNKAKGIIQAKKMSWTHINLDKQIQSKFTINEYPTNIFISKDGNVLFRKNQITRFDIFELTE